VYVIVSGWQCGSNPYERVADSDFGSAGWSEFRRSELQILLGAQRLPMCPLRTVYPGTDESNLWTCFPQRTPTAGRPRRLE
jgi:hypothetical protein